MNLEEEEGGEVSTVVTSSSVGTTDGAKSPESEEVPKKKRGFKKIVQDIIKKNITI